MIFDIKAAGYFGFRFLLVVQVDWQTREDTNIFKKKFYVSRSGGEKLKKSVVEKAIQ